MSSATGANCSWRFGRSHLLQIATLIMKKIKNFSSICSTVVRKSGETISSWLCLAARLTFFYFISLFLFFPSSWGRPRLNESRHYLHRTWTDPIQQKPQKTLTPGLRVDTCFPFWLYVAPTWMAILPTTCLKLKFLCHFQVSLFWPGQQEQRSPSPPCSGLK